LASVIRGLDGGVKILSEINMVLALLLLLFILVVGPTGEIFATAFSGAAAYAQHIVPLSMPFGREDINFSQPKLKLEESVFIEIHNKILSQK
jgi:BCCT family betaine/carnitine transporter